LEQCVDQAERLGPYQLQDLFELGEIDVLDTRTVRKALRAGSRQALGKHGKKEMLRQIETHIWKADEMVSFCYY